MLVTDKIRLDMMIDQWKENFRVDEMCGNTCGKSACQMAFINFLLTPGYSNEEIEYAITLIRNTQENSTNIYEILYPLILEYKTYGLCHFIEPEPEVQKPLTLMDKIKRFFKREDSCAIL